MENATSVLTVLPSTKEQKETFLKKATSEIQSGEYNPIEIEIQLKIMEDIAKELRKNIKKEVFAESEKYPEKSFEFKGMRITKSGKSTYDYSVCGHSEYNKLVQRKSELEESLKNAGKVEIVDPKTGEICKPPAIKYSEYLKIEYL